MYNKDNTREADEIFSRILSEMERQGRKYAELTEYLELPRGTFSSWKAGRSRNFCEHNPAGGRVYLIIRSRRRVEKSIIFIARSMSRMYSPKASQSETVIRQYWSREIRLSRWDLKIPIVS